MPLAGSAGYPWAHINDGGGDAGAHRDADLVECAVGGRGHQLKATGLQHGQDDFGFGVAESTVVFDQLGAGWGEHDAGEEHPDVGGAGSGHTSDRWFKEKRCELSLAGGIDAWHRTKGTHAAGVRAGIAFTNTLVVLSSGQRYDRGSIAHAEQAELFAGHPFFEHDGRAGLAELPAIDHRGDGLHGLVAALGNDHALAGSEPVGLDDNLERLLRRTRRWRPRLT